MSKRSRSHESIRTVILSCRTRDQLLSCQQWIDYLATRGHVETKAAHKLLELVRICETTLGETNVFPLVARPKKTDSGAAVAK